MIECRECLNKIYRNPVKKPNKGLNLNLNENIAGLPKEFLEKIFRNITPNFLASYPNYYELQNLIADHTNLDFQNICITNGSDAAIYHIFNTYLNPNDKVLYTLPIFAMYPIYSDIFNANKIEINYKDFSFPFELFKEKLENEDIKIAVVVNPCNPVGSLLEEEKIIELINLCKKRNTLIIIDEAYFYFSDQTIVNKVKEYDNLIVLRTFSKLCAIASARIGYICASKNIINNIYKVKQTFDGNGLGVLIASEILKEKGLIDDLISKFNEGKNYIVNKLKEHNFEYYEGNANFILIKLEDKVSKIVQELEKKHVFINGNYSHYVLKDYIRVTVSNKTIMEDFWQKFIAAYEKYKEC